MSSIRPARPTDHRTIVECVRTWWGDSRTPEEARELSLLLPRLFLEFFAGTSLVVEDEDGIRAFLVGFHSADNQDDAYIHFVGVDPRCRRQGVAGSLYNAFLERAAAAGRREVRAITSPGNTGSIAFHRALGFGLVDGDTYVGDLPVHSDYDGPGQHRVCFRRTIEPTGGTEGPDSRAAPTNLADSLPYRWSMFRHSLGDDAELGPLEPWQAAEFACHVDRVRGSIADWIPFAQWVVDEASARTYLQDYADRQAADTGRLFGIYVAGTLRGGIIVKVFDTTRGVCELGVWLDPAVRGRGLVTRAARVLIDWALRARAMTRIEWRCDPRNESSIAAARRLGFVHEGTHRKAWYHDGEHRDVQVWAIVT